MTPRWSRLALAAILAFGVCPGTALAAATADEGAGSACPCERDPAAAPSLVADNDHAPWRTASGGGAPLCAPAPITVAPRVDIELPVADARVSAVAPGPRHAPWRLAPKTSPPAR